MQGLPITTSNVEVKTIFKVLFFFKFLMKLIKTFKNGILISLSFFFFLRCGGWVGGPKLTVAGGRGI